MMKYAFMTWSTPTRTLDETLELAQRFGYEGVEWRVGRGRHYEYQTNQKHGVELNTTAAERDRTKKLIADSGIVSCCVATSCNYANPETTAVHVDETHEAIDLAADIDCTRLRIFGGQFPEEQTREKAIENVVGALKSLANHAADRGVTLCLETHDAWTDPNHIAAVMTGVDHANVMVNWDIMHPLRQSGIGPSETFEIIKPWIRHVHFHDGSKSLDKFEFLPLGKGDFDHREPLRLLKSIDFDGYLSGEWINWEPEEVHLPRELAVMKGYEAEL